MKLYMIRHGQSEANIGRMQAGQADSKLTEQGIRDAYGAKELLKAFTFDKVYSSDLSRAKITQEIAYPCENVIVTKMIREINVGKVLEHRTFVDCEKEYGKAYIQNRADYNFVPYGGENYEMLEKRAIEFLDIVKNAGGESVAAFSHGGFINAMLGCVLGCKVTNGKALSDNCGVSIFEYKEGKWSLRKWNTTADDKLTEYTSVVS